VWAIGDAAVMQDQRLPATAQGQPSRSIVSYETLTDSQTAVANQKAKYIVKKLNKIVRGRNSTKPFEFHNQGSLAYVGDWFVAMSHVECHLCSLSALRRKAIYDRSGAENVKTKESGRLAWLLWRSAYFTQTLSLRNKYAQHSRNVMLSLLICA
jgi:NADH dehydrogenase FAD-containing subunit